MLNESVKFKEPNNFYPNFPLQKTSNALEGKEFESGNQIAERLSQSIYFIANQILSVKNYTFFCKFLLFDMDIIILTSSFLKFPVIMFPGG